MIEDFPEKIQCMAIMPAADHLFTIRNTTDTKRLPEEQAISFHHNVAKLFL